MYSSNCFPATGEPTVLKIFPNDSLNFYMDVKVITSVSSRSCLFFWCLRCSLSFSFSSLSNKDLDSQWWSFRVSDHDTSEEPSLTTLRGNAEGFFKKVPVISWGQYTPNPTSHTVFQSSFSDLYNVVCQLYLFFKKKQKNTALLRYNSHKIHVKCTFQWIFVYSQSCATNTKI